MSNEFEPLNWILSLVKAVIGLAANIAVGRSLPWMMVNAMEKGDWVVLSSKKKSAIHFAEISGQYVNNPDGEDPYYHFREVKWLATDIPRSNFDQDLLYSFAV